MDTQDTINPPREASTDPTVLPDPVPCGATTDATPSTNSDTVARTSRRRVPVRQSAREAREKIQDVLYWETCPESSELFQAAKKMINSEFERFERNHGRKRGRSHAKEDEAVDLTKFQRVYDEESDENGVVSEDDESAESCDDMDSDEENSLKDFIRDDDSDVTVEEGTHDSDDPLDAEEDYDTGTDTELSDEVELLDDTSDSDDVEETTAETQSKTRDGHTSTESSK